MAGDLRAVNVAVRILGQRARLLGLYQAVPARPDVNLQTLVVGPAEGNPGQATEVLSPAQQP
jgi:hypothetical protein